MMNRNQTLINPLTIKGVQNHIAECTDRLGRCPIKLIVCSSSSIKHLKQLATADNNPFAVNGFFDGITIRINDVLRIGTFEFNCNYFERPRIQFNEQDYFT